MDDSLEMDDMQPMLEDNDYDRAPTSKRLPPVPSDLLSKHRRIILSISAVLGLLLLSMMGGILFQKYFTLRSNIPPPSHDAEDRPPAYNPPEVAASSLNYSKVATILETNMFPELVPLLVSYMAIAPVDWPFVVWCSENNYDALSRSSALSQQIATGRLNLTMLPSEYDVESHEMLSRFLTKPWFWHQFQPEAEWMFFFQVDATLCAASEQSLDDWIGYDWVGAPTAWSHEFGHGGNGGLSMRKISTMQRVTAITDPTFARKDWNGETPDEGVWYGDSEDYWFMNAIDKTMGSEARWPEDDALDQNDFSITWDKEVLRPLGVHKSSGWVELYDSEAFGEDEYTSLLRLLEYCPELYIVLREW